MEARTSSTSRIIIFQRSMPIRSSTHGASMAHDGPCTFPQSDIPTTVTVGVCKCMHACIRARSGRVLPVYPLQCRMYMYITRDIISDITRV